MIIRNMSIAELTSRYNVLGQVLIDNNNGKSTEIYGERLQIRSEIRTRVQNQKISQMTYRAEISHDSAEKFKSRGIIFKNM